MERSERYDVLWPLGKSCIEPIQLSRRVGALYGRRIGFVWDYVFRGDEMWEVIKDELRSRWPTVEPVDHSVFGNIHGPDERAVTEALPARLRAAELDSVIVGTGA